MPHFPQSTRLSSTTLDLTFIDVDSVRRLSFFSPIFSSSSSSSSSQVLHSEWASDAAAFHPLMNVSSPLLLLLKEFLAFLPKASAALLPNLINGRLRTHRLL